MSSRPLRAALALLFAAAPFVPAERAHAQAACAAGTMADYTAEGFSCRLGAWVVSDFFFYSGVTAVGGATGTAAGAESVSLTPFVGHDALGRTTFGFDFAGYAMSVDGNGSMETNLFGNAELNFDFELTAVAPGAALGGARVGGAETVTGAPRPGDSWGAVQSGIVASVSSMFPSSIFDQCLYARDVAESAVDRTIDHAGVCELDTRPRNAGVSLSTWAQVSGGEPAAALVAGARTAATRLEFTEVAAVPEPATVALVGGGLLALAGTAARRRRASGL